MKSHKTSKFTKVSLSKFPLYGMGPVEQAPAYCLSPGISSVILPWFYSTWLYHGSACVYLTKQIVWVSGITSIFRQSWNQEEVGLYLESNDIKTGVQSNTLPHSQTREQDFKPGNGAKP